MLLVGVNCFCAVINWIRDLVKYSCGVVSYYGLSNGLVVNFCVAALIVCLWLNGTYEWIT